MLLAQQLYANDNSSADAWNFGPIEHDCYPVSRVADLVVSIWGNNAHWITKSDMKLHETNQLKLDCSKAKSKLRWTPTWNLIRSIKETVIWYQAFINKSNHQEFTINQINKFEKEIKT